MGNTSKDGNSMVTEMVTFINPVLTGVCNPYVTMLPLLPYKFPKIYSKISDTSNKIKFVCDRRLRSQTFGAAMLQRGKFFKLLRNLMRI
jgi:hypothetical protein